ncbi:MAG TPA: DUF2069 domain-containing protein [Gammaproteobacteria bacterium]|jgi:uncharacterized membrane protein|nr:DUF2069 domain-containing protein [Gammaproteobacteria bacterium]
MNASRIFYGITIAGYFGTLVLMTAWFAWLYPPQKAPISLTILLIAGPLLLPLRGILKEKRYTIAWSCFLALLYFIHGVLEAWHTAPTRTLGMMEVLFTTMWFSGAIGYIQVTKNKQ